MITAGMEATHRKTQEVYKIVSVSKIKLDGTWLENKCVTYKNEYGQLFSRLETDFLIKFDIE